MLANLAPRRIQLALGSYSVTATYGADTYGEGSSGPPRTRTAPPAPTLSPGPGSYTLPQFISISCATPDAVIYYSINNALPTKYTGPFPLTDADTIQAVAIVQADGEYLESPVAIAAYTATAPAPEPPVISPAGGVFDTPQTVVIHPTASGATLYVSVNGEAPQKYAGPLLVETEATIAAVAIGRAGSLYAESSVVVGIFKSFPERCRSV